MAAAVVSLGGTQVECGQFTHTVTTAYIICGCCSRTS